MRAIRRLIHTWKRLAYAWRVRHIPDPLKEKA